MATQSTPFFDAAVTAAVNVSTACRGRLMGFQAYNVNTTDAFLQVFNVPAASVTLGTTTPIQSYLIPRGNATDRGGAAESFLPDGLILDGSAISIAATTTEAGSTTVTTGLEVNLQYS